MDFETNDGPVDGTIGRDPKTGRFGPGNKASKGRQPGSRNKLTAILDGEIEDVLRGLIAQAKRGSVPAAIAVCRMVIGPAKERNTGGESNVTFEFKTPTSTGEARQLLSDITAAVGAGVLDADQAQVMVAATSEWLKSHETHELQKAHDLLKQEVAALQARSNYRIAR